MRSGENISRMICRIESVPITLGSSRRRATSIARDVLPEPVAPPSSTRLGLPSSRALRHRRYQPAGPGPSVRSMVAATRWRSSVRSIAARPWLSRLCSISRATSCASAGSSPAPISETARMPFENGLHDPSSSTTRGGSTAVTEPSASRS